MACDLITETALITVVSVAYSERPTGDEFCRDFKPALRKKGRPFNEPFDRVYNRFGDE